MPLPRAHRLLALVAVGFGIAALLVADPSRFVRWDESIYLSQVHAAAAPVGWGPTRALGLPALLWPVAMLGAPIGVVRVAFAGLMAAGLWVAFLPWVRAAGDAAVIGAAGFAAFWATLIAGASLMPNLPTALAGVAAGGAAVRLLHDPRSRGALAGLMAALAVAAVVRPPDGLYLGAGLGLLILWRLRGAAWRPIVAAGVGVAFGWGVFAVDALWRFDGLGARLQAALDTDSARPDAGIRLFDYVAQGDPISPLAAAITVVVITGLAVLGLTDRGQRREAALVANVGALAILLPYLLVHEGDRVRFLLPALALACVAAGVGLARLWQAGGGSRVLRMAVVAACLVGLGWNVTAAWIDGRRVNDQSDFLETLAIGVRDAAQQQPCAFFEQYARPSVAYGSGCVRHSLDLDLLAEGSVCENTGCPARSRSDDAADLLAHDGVVVVVVARPGEAEALAQWRELPLERSRGHHLFVHPATDPQ